MYCVLSLNQHNLEKKSFVEKTLKDIESQLRNINNSGKKK